MFTKGEDSLPVFFTAIEGRYGIRKIQPGKTNDSCTHSVVGLTVNEFDVQTVFKDDAFMIAHPKTKAGSMNLHEVSR